MISHTLDEDRSILHIKPQSALEREDFEKLAEAVDPFIARTGGLAGIVIEAPSFPGWKSFGAMVAHLRFVRDHHRKISRIAVVTDSALGNVAEHLAPHFVAAEIRRFAPSEVEAAGTWVAGGD
jgi:hypothetical protein